MPVIRLALLPLLMIVWLTPAYAQTAATPTPLRHQIARGGATPLDQIQRAPAAPVRLRMTKVPPVVVAIAIGAAAGVMVWGIRMAAASR